MVIRLQDYSAGHKVVSLALTEQGAQELENRQLEYVAKQEQGYFLEPEGIRLDIPEKEQEKLAQCHDRDVFQIYRDGQMFRFYDASSADNAFMMLAHCNSNCIMCPATDAMREENDRIADEDLLELVKHIPKDANHITITGGEPFLYGEQIFELFHAFRLKGGLTNYQLLTNGRALSYQPYALRFHETAPERMVIGIPLHGYDAASHDAITRSPGGFEQTRQGIHNLLQFGHRVELRMVVSGLNAANITKIAQLIINEFPDCLRVEIMGLEMLGNAAKYQDRVWIPYREAFLASKDAVDLLIRHGIEVELYNFPLCAIDREYWHIAVKSISTYKVRFMPACDQCRVKDACGGFFAGTIRLAGKDARPVTGNA